MKSVTWIAYEQGLKYCPVCKMLHDPVFVMCRYCTNVRLRMRPKAGPSRKRIMEAAHRY